MLFRSLQVLVETFTGVDQSTPIGTPANNSGTSATASVTVSSTAGEWVVDAMADFTRVPTIGAGQTQIASSLYLSTLFQSSTANGAASVTMSWTFSPLTQWAIVAMPIKPVIILPIDLLYFNAACEEGKVNIIWSTATEINNDYFTLERSTDAINFSEVTKIKGAGNSSSLKNYFHTDENNSEIKPFYYRLTQTDYDGKSEVFPLITLAPCKNIETNSSINIYPNPASSEITINYFLLEDDNAKITLYDLSGKEMMKISNQKLSGGADQKKVSTGSLPSGLYFIKITTTEKEIIQQLIINKNSTP